MRYLRALQKRRDTQKEQLDIKFLIQFIHKQISSWDFRVLNQILLSMKRAAIFLKRCQFYHIRKRTTEGILQWKWELWIFELNNVFSSLASTREIKVFSKILLFLRNCRLELRSEENFCKNNWLSNIWVGKTSSGRLWSSFFYAAATPLYTWILCYNCCN